MPNYPHLVEPQFTDGDDKNKNFMRNMNVSFIWGIWYTQTFVMLVVMLNFIIAVITATYDEVTQNQVFIHYKYKAELNLECFELLDYIGYPKKFKILLFSIVKDESKIQHQNRMLDPILQQVIDIRKFISTQSNKQHDMHDNILNSISKINEEQTSIKRRMHKEFDEFKIKNQEVISGMEKLTEATKNFDRLIHDKYASNANN